MVHSFPARSSKIDFAFYSLVIARRPRAEVDQCGAIRQARGINNPLQKKGG
jgi:hypothetical protein